MDEILNLLGIASRAKKLVYGSDMLKDLSKVKLLFIAKSFTGEKIILCPRPFGLSGCVTTQIIS